MVKIGLVDAGLNSREVGTAAGISQVGGWRNLLGSRTISEGSFIEGSLIPKKLPPHRLSEGSVRVWGHQGVDHGRQIGRTVDRA